MTDPAGMVCTSGIYRGKNIDICVDQAEYTNERRNRAAAEAADTVQVISVTSEGKQIEIVGNRKNADTAWRKFAKTTPALNKGVAGYILRMHGADNVFPKSRTGFDDPDHPLVDVPGRAIPLDDGRVMLGAQELCGLETVKIKGKWYKKRLLTPDEWAAFASAFGTKEYSTRTGALDKGVHHHAEGTRAVGQAEGHYVEYRGKEVYDMSGNVAELTYDPVTDKFYVNGGSYVNNRHFGPLALQAESRSDGLPPDTRASHFGLRCGASPQDPPIRG